MQILKLVNNVILLGFLLFFNLLLALLKLGIITAVHKKIQMHIVKYVIIQSIDL